MGRQSKKRGDVREHTAGSLCCTAETNTHCKADCTPIKINNKKTTPVGASTCTDAQQVCISTEASERFLNWVSLDQKMQDQGSVRSIRRGPPNTWLHVAQRQWAQGPEGKAFLIAELLGESIQIVLFFLML